MIFRPELVRQIRAGRKTMTRRPLKTDRCSYQPGKSYAVQPGRGQTATCRIKIVSVHQEPVGAITYADARAEGFQTTEDFKAYWISIHDKAWLEREHAMLDAAENDHGVLDCDVWIMRRSVDRFDWFHADKSVWVIRFHLDADPVVRLLAARSDELYTSNPARALSGEPEAVDLETQKRITKEAGTRTAQWIATEGAARDRDRAAMSREDQLARLTRSARLRSVDVSRELWALHNSLSSATRERFDEKVRKTEARVFGAAA